MPIKFEVIEIPKETILFEKGDVGDSAYVVVSGNLEITTLDDGQKLILGNVGPGELVGEMAIMESVPRNATATATEETTLRVIEGEQLRGYLKTLDPDVQQVFELMAARRLNNLELLLESRLDEEN